MEFNEHYNSALLAEYTVPLWFILLSFSIFLLRTFANPSSFTALSHFTVTLSYFFSLGIISLAPTDIALTVVGRRENYNCSLVPPDRPPTIYEENHPKIYVLYNIMFWPCVLLSSVVLPFLEKFNQDYHFTTMSKIQSSLRKMAKTYIVFSVLGGAAVTFLIYKKIFSSFEAIVITCKALQNTAGLIVIVVLCGYGLVEFPRTMWRKSSYKVQLQRTKVDLALTLKLHNDAYLHTSAAVANARRT